MTRQRDSRPFPSILLVAFLCAGILAPSAVAAQQGESGETSLRTGWHVVRPGDTLRGLSRRLSGNEALWRRNAALNPEVTDPDLLIPGQRLRLLLVQEVPVDVARVTKITRTVDLMPAPNPWDSAIVDDLLREYDGIRTQDRSSTEMRFADGSDLRITENSLVFLRQVGERLVSVERDQIEIVEGEADLSNRRAVAETPGIEIIVGTATSTPKAGPSGLETRARKGDAGAAQVMVFEGESTVAAEGAVVEVEQGMGTTVEQGSPPSPPEKLLDAPQPAFPATGANLDFSNPTFAWSAVDGAAGYRLELCFDAECGRLARRISTGTQTVFRTTEEPLARGDYHWRVSAISPTGLDGYASGARALAITGDGIDDRAPEITVSWGGRMIRSGEKLVVGPNSVLSIEADDGDGSGVGSWTYRLDGRVVGKDDWTGPWTAGDHVAAASVADRVGNALSIEPLEFVGDPDPPEIVPTVGGGEVLSESGEWRSEQRSSRRQQRRARKLGIVAEWSSDGRRWLPIFLPIDPETGAWTRSSDRLEIGRSTADRPYLFLRSTGGNPFAADSPIALAEGRILRLRITDAIAGVGEVAFGVARRTDSSGAERRYLWLEAADLIDNVERIEWPLASGSR